MHSKIACHNTNIHHVVIRDCSGLRLIGPSLALDDEAEIHRA